MESEEENMEVPTNGVYLLLGGGGGGGGGGRALLGNWPVRSTAVRITAASDQ